MMDSFLRLNRSKHDYTNKLLVYNSPFSLLIILVIILIVNGCASNYFKIGNNMFASGHYRAAAEYYDLFISQSTNGALITEAINNRSKAYYRLGQREMSKNNYRAAIRFFYLSNTTAADNKMVDSYLIIAENAYDNEEIDTVLDLYNFMIKNFQASPFISEVIYRRLKVYHKHYDDKYKVWDDYLLLVDYYSDNKFIKKAIPIVDNYIPSLINDSLELKNTHGHFEAISELLNIYSYQHSYHEVILEKVGILYYQLASLQKEENDFLSAYEYYNKAINYYPALEENVKENLNQMITSMIQHGDSLLRERRIADAIKIYMKTYNISPDNPQAKIAIAKAHEMESNIKEATKLFQEALRYEGNNDYKQALRLYEESLAKDKLQTTSEKISLMENMIKIDEDPVSFAKSIIIEYRDGTIVNTIEDIVQQLKDSQAKDIRESGWKVLMSTGANRYEVRYDVTSREINYYFIWQVNLLNRNIIPLNQESERIME